MKPNKLQAAFFIIVAIGAIFGLICIAKIGIEKCIHNGGTFRYCANI